MNGISTVPSGTFAGRYHLERQLGSGGTAIVYLARDQQRGHMVAIKVLKGEFAESLGADRFLKEIQLSQQLHHPHILPVLDSGKYDGQLFFVLPHMEEGTLRARLERHKQLPLEEVVAITRTIAAALEHAHEQGLVHRDVKPENILFTSGQACLGDFGIARALERALGDSTTSTSVVRGTPQYMSPEQASGEPALDARSDIYSLGCVVYEMLAGIQPFVGPSPESIIAQRLNHLPRPVRVYRPTIPAAVESVLERALAISRADRYPKATELADALERATRTPDDRRAHETKARRRRSVTLGAAAALAAAAVVALMTLRSSAPVDGAIPEGDPRRIAVLYLDALTPLTAPAHVADGITEDLIDQLGSVRALHVISPHGVRPYRGSDIPFDSIGRALKVGTIVTGSVARSGSTIRVNLRLVDAATGRQLYSRALDEEWTDLFTLQNKLANQVAFTFRQRLGEEIALRENRAATKSLAAWETVQMAGTEIRRATETATRSVDPLATSLLFLRADSLYARAQQLDPNWNLPLVRRGRIALGLSLQPPPPASAADSVAFRTMTPMQRRVPWIQRAIEIADSAVRHTPRSAEALALRGEARYALLTTGISGSDSLGPLAERDLRAALDVKPDLANAWTALAQLALQRGLFADAAAAAQRAFDADAFFEVRRVISNALLASLYAEQFDDARRWCRLGLTHYAGDPRFTECELTLLGWTGRSRTDASAAWRLLKRIEDRDTVGMLAAASGHRRLLVAAVLARAGLRDSAASVLRRVQAQPSPDPTRRNSALAEAHVLLLLDHRDAAVARLNDYLAVAPQMSALVREHPWFRAVRRDPRFERMLRGNN